MWNHRSARSRFGKAACLFAVCATASLPFAPAASNAGPTTPLVPEWSQRLAPVPVEMALEKVALISGLIGIERDLLLGQLFLKDHLVSTEGSHFTHPRHENFPVIKDALAQAGAPDLEPLLIELENATDQKSVDAAYIAVLAGVKKSLEALQPTEQEVLAAVIETAREAHEMLDPSGTTEVGAYQEAWGLLMAARGKLDGMIFSQDPAIKTSATKMALAFDDVVLFAPDPAAKAPVKFDPAMVGNLVAELSGKLQSI